MSGITWMGGFYRIAWAHEAGRLVVSPVFEDLKTATGLSRHIESWNDRFVRMTIIESEKEYAVCCYQDPLVAGDASSVGVYKPGLPRISGYDQAKPLFLERPPMFQVAFASNYARMETYEQVSRLVSPARCRIISDHDLRRQEYYYERSAAIEGSHL